jgi:hypothetical protein
MSICNNSSPPTKPCKARLRSRNFVRREGSWSHYHANNGWFVGKGFVNHVNTNRQSTTYCGVNPRFQNRMAEKRIRDLQDQTTTMLLHAKLKWPKSILANL